MRSVSEKERIIESAFNEAKSISGMRQELRDKAQEFISYMQSEEFFYEDIEQDVKNKLWRLYIGVFDYLKASDEYIARITSIACEFGLYGVEYSSFFLGMLINKEYRRKDNEESK